ncbi:ABC transporter substrate-binding protein [Pandoraea pnomenusa]|uniref:substrate-binding domain-containing protein n=1 Tax=Pandoraea pnomenusa TaxID=93220 RepID=UPI000437551E|nr:PhnD/SsuA/transferrin family substrate-binding protein [Pandoraea pnomenusa]AHN74564.1 ABC transporter substrate-binding protein [Pandoraea pnomenusa]
MSGLPFSNTRRTLIHAVGASVGLAACGAVRSALAAPQQKVLFGTTAVFLDNQVRLLSKWRAHLESHLEQEVQFVQRGSYGEITEMLLADQLDVAWVCGYPYVTHTDRMKLLAIPQYKGRPLYQSYLIVPKSQQDISSITELRGKVFAYSDPQSNSGYLVPRTELIRNSLDPRSFFSRTFFTFAHRKVAEAVSTGLASAGEIDGYVFDTMAKQLPDSVSGVRVAWKSPAYGFPPLVARKGLSMETFARIQLALLAMPESADGRELLEHLNLDRFVIGDDRLFDSIRSLVRISDTMPT